MLIGLISVNASEFPGRPSTFETLRHKPTTKDTTYGRRVVRRLDRADHDERRYLAPLKEYVARGFTLAEELLGKYATDWHGSVAPVFQEYAY